MAAVWPLPTDKVVGSPGFVGDINQLAENMNDLHDRDVEKVEKPPPGSDGAVLVADAGEPGGVRWGAVDPGGAGDTATAALVAGPSDTHDALTGQIAALGDKAIYNVRNHGVTGDGITDDTAAIEAAAAAFAAFGGGRLYFPRGTYLFHTIALTIDNVVLEGDGDETHLLSTYLESDATPAIRWIGSNIGMRKMKVEAQTKLGTPTAGYENYDLLRIGGTGSAFESGVLIDDVTFIDGGGCNAYRTADVRIINSRYTASHGNSFGCVEVQSDVLIHGNTATDGNDDLIAVTCDSNVPGGTKRVIITSNNLARTDAKAIGTSGIASGVVANNHIEDTGAPGIQIFTDAVYGLEPSDKVLITDNILIRPGQWYGAGRLQETRGTAAHGVYFSGDNISVSGNQIYDAALHGIVSPTADLFQVVRNKIIDPGKNCVWLGDDTDTTYDLVTRGTVTGNICVGGEGGITVGSGRRLKVYGNSIEGWHNAGESRGLFVSSVADSDVHDNALHNTAGGTYGYRVKPGTTNPQLRSWNNETFTTGGGAPDGAMIVLDRRIAFAAAAPTSGTWAAGDVVINSAPAPGSVWAWYCRVGGTPGSWQPAATGGRQVLGANTAAWDPVSIASMGFASQTFTVTGAVAGDPVSVGMPGIPSGVILSGQVTAANTVTVTIFNATGSAVDVASGTVRLLVTRMS